MNKTKIDIAIVGGGAAGLFCAVECARRAPDASIVVYEATDKVGRPILRSGNGRCNFSHNPMDASLYHNAAFVRQAYASLGAPDEVLRAWERLGLVWSAEEDGRLYPSANRASVVMDVLLRALRQSTVTIRLEVPIRRLTAPTHDGGPFTLELSDGALERADHVILACGGALTEALAPQPLSMKPLHPILGPLRLKPNPFASLDGQRHHGRVSVQRNGAEVAVEEGELLFRKYGISGIAVFNLSRFAQPGDQLMCDFRPEDGPLDRTVAWLAERRALLSDASESLTVGDVLTGLVSRGMGEVLCTLADMPPTVTSDEASDGRLARALRAATVTVADMGPKDGCQGVRGGLRCNDLNPSTMEARQMPGLYVLGDAVDVDGPCGGYNLHWAWSSALLAARAQLRVKNEL